MSIFGRWAVLLMALFVSSRSLTAMAQETHQVVAFDNAAFTIKINRPQQLCELLQKWSEDFYEDPQQRPTLEQTQEALLYWLELEGTKGIDFTREMWIGVFLNDDSSFHFAIVSYPQDGSTDRIQASEGHFSQAIQDRIILTDTKELFETVSLVSSESNQWASSQASLRFNPKRIGQFVKTKLVHPTKAHTEFGVRISNGELPKIVLDGEDITSRLKLSCKILIQCYISVMELQGTPFDSLEQTDETLDIGFDLDEESVTPWIRLQDETRTVNSSDSVLKGRALMVPEFDPHATVKFIASVDRLIEFEKFQSTKLDADQRIENEWLQKLKRHGAEIIQASFSMASNNIDGMARGGLLFSGTESLDVANLKTLFLETWISHFPKGLESIETVLVVNDEDTSGGISTGEMAVNPAFVMNRTGLSEEEIHDASGKLHTTDMLLGIDRVLTKYASNKNNFLFATGGNQKQFRDFLNQNFDNTPKVIDLEKSNPLPPIAVVLFRPFESYRSLDRFGLFTYSKRALDLLDKYQNEIATLSAGSDGSSLDLRLRVPKSVFVGLREMTKDPPASEIDPAFR